MAIQVSSVFVANSRVIAENVILIQGGDAKILNSQIEADLRLTDNFGALEASGNMIGGEEPGVICETRACR